MPFNADYYNHDYFEIGNYRHYTSGWYRFWHWTKFTWVGLQLKALGCRTVLDFGCADGVSVAAFRRLGLVAWGVDLSAYALSRVPESAQPYVWQGGLRDKEFPPQFFDVIVSWDVLEHLAPEAVAEVLDDFAIVGRRALLGIYVSDEVIAHLHRAWHKPHPDHLSEHPAAWWQAQFQPRGWKVRRVPLARKGTFWADFAPNGIMGP